MIRSCRTSRAFSLTELTVAVGTAALLTVAVGAMFRSVGNLSSTGVALTELDQVARSLERQLRADFEALNRLPSDESFLAIRYREVGDLNRNGSVDLVSEQEIYLTAEDRDRDLRLQYAPYQRNASGEQLGRGVTRRLDELMFLGLAGGTDGLYTSQQQASDGATAIGANAARIYYGHALKPLPDPEFDLSDEERDVPRRQWIPDGVFGTAPGRAFEWGGVQISEGVATGRNQFASEWILARQALLLAGGDAAGTLNAPSNASHPIGRDRFYAPYIRDAETATRFANQDPYIEGYVTLGPFQPTTPDIGPIGDHLERPDPRYISHGRVDIAAQSLQDVRRWLEGERPPHQSTPQAITYAGAYSGGAFFDPASTLAPGVPPTANIYNDPLWLRVATGSVNPPPSNSANQVVLYNDRNLRAAIAGSFTRLLAESGAPPVDRFEPPNTGPYTERPESSGMDLHATLAARCSNFEVAWSDGTTALRPIDLDGDGIFEFQPGDIIWFDISVIHNANGAPIRRSTFTEWFYTPGSETVVDFVRFRNPTTTSLDSPEQAPGFPETIGNMPLAQAGLVNIFRVAPPASNPTQAYYDRRFTGSADPAFSSVVPRAEAFAIWGFRLPNGAGDYGEAWRKPTMIRIRATLHDPENRIVGGKTYEYVFRINPRD